MLDDSALEPWVVEGDTRVVFEHVHHPTILEEEVRLPNGRVISWLRYADERDGVRHRDGVMGICVRDGEVLLARQYNHGAQRVVWEFPGGGTEPEESYETAVRRELMEEVGFYPHDVDYLGRFLMNNRRSPWGIRTYLATNLEERRLRSDDAEFVEAMFVPEREVERLIAAGEIDNVTMLAGWAFYRASQR